jgi:hypothetical protein
MLAEEDLLAKDCFNASAQRVAANVGDDAAAKRSLAAAARLARLPGVFIGLIVAFHAFFRWLVFFLEVACGLTRGVPNKALVLWLSLKSFGSVPKGFVSFFVDPLVGMTEKGEEQNKAN